MIIIISMNSCRKKNLRHYNSN